MLSIRSSPCVATEERRVERGLGVTWNSTCVRYHDALGWNVGRPYMSRGKPSSFFFNVSSLLG